jgi:hypothetical protein
MTRVTSLLPRRAARAAVVAAFLSCFATAELLAQDEGAAPETQPLETIPVDSTEAAPADVGPRYPYTFAALRLRHTELDDSASDGIGLEGSYLVLPNIYAVGAITRSEADDANSTESTLFELGGGYRQEIMAGMDLNAGLRVLHDDIKSEPQSQVKMGLRADVGVRKQLLPQLEGALAVSYVERSRLARGFLSGSALYAFTPSLSVGAEIVASSNSMAYGLLGRWAF